VQIKSKLVILELLAGIFGWTWIIALVAAIYYLVMAIFSDSLWSSFFWAFGIGAITKWLTRGLQDNKFRIAYEAKLIGEGYTPEEASQKWSEEYFGNGKDELVASSQAILAETDEILKESESIVTQLNDLSPEKREWVEWFQALPEDHKQIVEQARKDGVDINPDNFQSVLEIITNPQT
jgi:hypothetical protein